MHNKVTHHVTANAFQKRNGREKPASLYTNWNVVVAAHFTPETVQARGSRTLTRGNILEAKGAQDVVGFMTCSRIDPLSGRLYTRKWACQRWPNCCWTLPMGATLWWMRRRLAMRCSLARLQGNQRCGCYTGHMESWGLARLLWPVPFLPWVRFWFGQRGFWAQGLGSFQGSGVGGYMPRNPDWSHISSLHCCGVFTDNGCHSTWLPRGANPSPV